ncbi:hypothetical protein PIB30_008997 [Stylosanthes scabra]|uniref:Uncharacterized protein n=1 Tax=Stylosanthes scabra TaxID=79078 RepID=A0ABU6S4X3_9FABA|nr:hypothetical protein [Stylosanthes scabra]
MIFQTVKTSIQSHYATFKLIIYPTLPDVDGFRTRLLGDQPSASVRITQVTSQGGSAAINNLRRCTEKVMNIEQVMDREDEGQLWIARYKVEIVVCDGTGGISLLLWDNHVLRLCGKTAEQIKIEAVNRCYCFSKFNMFLVDCLYHLQLSLFFNHGQRDEQYPETLDLMMEKVLLFRIHVRSGHLKRTVNVYSVAALCNDDELVAINLLKDFVINGSDSQMVSVFRTIIFHFPICFKFKEERFGPLGKR